MESDSFLGNIRNDIATIYIMMFVIIGVLVGVIFMSMITIYLSWQSNSILSKNIEYINNDIENNSLNNINDDIANISNISNISSFHR